MLITHFRTFVRVDGIAPVYIKLSTGTPRAIANIKHPPIVTMVSRCILL